jgi:hypothetical protein
MSKPNALTESPADQPEIDAPVYDDALDVIKALRNWFYDTIGVTSAEPPSTLWYALEDVQRYLRDTRIDTLLESIRTFHENKRKRMSEATSCLTPLLNTLTA